MVSGVCASLAALAAGVTLGIQPGGARVATAVAAVLLASIGVTILVWGIAYRRLTYRLGTDAFEVRWLGRTLHLPYAAIDGIYPGQRLAGHTQPERSTWPGVYVGRARVSGLGLVRYFTTSREPSHLTVITTPTAGVALSASDPVGFRAALIERAQDAEPLDDASLDLTEAPPSSAPWTALHDRWLPATLGAALILFLLIFAGASLQYEHLPEQIPLRFNAAGQPTEIASRADLFRLPLGGLIVVLVNLAGGILLHPRERVLARLLWIGATLVQAGLLIAVLRLT